MNVSFAIDDDNLDLNCIGIMLYLF